MRPLKPCERRPQFQNPASPVFVSELFPPWQVIEIPAGDGFHLPVEQPNHFTCDFIKRAGAHRTPFTIAWKAAQCAGVACRVIHLTLATTSHSAKMGKA